MSNALDDTINECLSDTVEGPSAEHNRGFSFDNQAISPLLEALKTSLTEKAEVNYSKVDHLKELIALGEYEINEGAIANRMSDPIEVV
ncbi:MAG: hypothetical protein CK426_02695 [Legionella sp.]|nr:MAG: hypothetical protein CK423_08550 [Legionella sp.]PJD99440.1 MAG: hypothetical protein CK426_02695 [Legionella sp.]